MEMANLDNDQFVVSHIAAYRGDPTVRTTMEFEIHFQDGDVRWLTWTPDLFETTHYEDFCRSNPALYPLLYSASEAKKIRTTLNRTAITEIAPGDTVYVDLRCFGAVWYNQLALPDLDHTHYVVLTYVVQFYNRACTKVTVRMDVFDLVMTQTHEWVLSYGSVKHFDPASMTLVDSAFTREFPQVLQDVV
jgi:hypothetical protein